MESPEQMGRPPEEPKEEPMKDKEETLEKPAPPKSHNEAEWKKIEERRKGEEMEDEERELNASISRDATFADLFNAIDAIEKEEGLGELHFEEELWDNFDAAIVQEVLALRDVQTGKAATIKVLDFFKERGYSQSDVSVFLPIKFTRERKKKQ
ncbi:MAG: hypothetical protein Q8R13_03675 [bacterium]|nr:hypothetical protein [bacterium]